MHENLYASPELLPPGPVDSAKRRPKLVYWIASGIIAVIVLGLLLPLADQSLWVGRFGLTIHVDAHPAVDQKSARFAACWDQPQTTLFLSLPDDEYDLPWLDAGRNEAANDWTIDVPCSGRRGWTRIGDTYNEPRFIVVEYKSIASGVHSKHRKQFLIPKGRGARSMTIILP